ncbi:hypothetical protein TanjilG_22645 [Lupinus angustifolius]|uniref:Uncharacterized protein n=1 Tax=Lupinus angustifolius TaxID=3871 RepID=A0A4P1RT69_LUPAN|nr:hypothetical protein TanjilG_22645 [Lupinus angustifolius]
MAAPPPQAHSPKAAEGAIGAARWEELKEYYKNLMKDLVEGAATIETFHQRLLMESSSFAMPLGVSSFSTYPSRLGSDCPRTIFI